MPIWRCKKKRVDILPKAIQAKECLRDNQVKAEKDRPQLPVRGGYKGDQPSNGGPSRSGGDLSATKSKAPSSGSNIDASNNNDLGRTPPSGCRHCGRPHQNNKCPHAQMNAHQTFDDGRDDDTDDADQKEPTVGTSAGIRKKKDPCPTNNNGKKKAEDGPPLNQEKTLMFVEMKVSGKPIRAMIDTSATHNYLASTQVERLGLVVGKGRGRVKAINSPPELVGGIAKGVPVKLGPYEGKFNLCVVIIDDFELIVGLEFMRKTNTIPIPYADMLCMMGENGSMPCIIPCTTTKMVIENILALQLKKGVKRHEPTFLATLYIEDIECSSSPIPALVKELLKEFEDVMPEDMPRRLPPRQTMDHEIELVSVVNPPARAPYRMSQHELTELQR
ncbi:uncharacterized protein [Nicotiana tomentosiformis]|uniref:uncharacterized protein n=1 Tax=Nicotiana tomentosiformis TaxID=4098 RepID=UPI00388CA2F2